MTSVVLASMASPRRGAVARRIAPRGAGPTASVAGASPVATRAPAARAGRSLALGVAVTGLLERLADRTRHRQTRDRHCLAPPRLPILLDVEEPPTHRSTGRIDR